MQFAVFLKNVLVFLNNFCIKFRIKSIDLETENLARSQIGLS